MEPLLEIALGQVFWLIFGIVVVILFLILIVFFPKKKLCEQCKEEKTRNRTGICDSCSHEQLLQKAKDTSPDLVCPLHGEIMETHIILDVDDLVIVHTCSYQTCDLIVMDRKHLSKLTLMQLDFYPA